MAQPMPAYKMGEFEGKGRSGWTIFLHGAAPGPSPGPLFHQPLSYGSLTHLTTQAFCSLYKLLCGNLLGLGILAYW